MERLLFCFLNERSFRVKSIVSYPTYDRYYYNLSRSNIKDFEVKIIDFFRKSLSIFKGENIEQR